jgi:hypothetical protein
MKAADELSISGAHCEAWREGACAGKGLLRQRRVQPMTVGALLRVALSRDPRGLEGNEPSGVSEQRQKRAHGVGVIKVALPEQGEHVLP